ncbi:MAG: 3-carboxy-cis,cis-muconate cycloisomerase [Anaerolineae bacterium]|nr:3-carboxy-cis,cis-muconate cycloisomerase [Anaerolineales bacterium]MCQ3973268.1 3-carboxy-cis,cis-muconate cycloisomerase [Anaerolineae bacterium]
MAFSPTDSKIYAPLFSDPDMAAIFADEQFVRTLLEVEAALARAQGRLGVIPVGAAQQIVAGAQALQPDFERLQTGVEKAGLPIIELVRQLRAQVGAEAASYVHWGATTQDIMDTALVLQIRAALSFSEAKLLRLIKNLAEMAAQHQETLMAGRTHAQQALPISFGLKVATWLAPLLRHRQRLVEMRPRLLVVQFGGAAGTLASLGDKGTVVEQALADELGLAVPLLPWHTQRDTLAELAGWLSLLSGSLAKMGQDIILLAQTEVGEVNESADFSRGGSSTMPQKSNPIISELIIAAARTNANLLASLHQALVQEHERATHGWQLEWLNLPQMFALTAAALRHALFLSENLVVNKARMRQNVAASNGLMLAEALNFALAEHMDRAEAKQRIGEAVQEALAQNRHLVDVVREKVAAPLDWAALKDEANYLGSAQAFIERVLRQAAEIQARQESMSLS